MDYGNRSHVDLDLLMEIPYQLLELPFQVRQRSSYGVNLEVTWSTLSPQRGSGSQSGKGLAWSHRPNLSAFFPIDLSVLYAELKYTEGFTLRKKLAV